MAPWGLRCPQLPPAEFRDPFGSADGPRPRPSGEISFLNCSVGRAIIFAATLILFGLIAAGIVNWNSPLRRIRGDGLIASRWVVLCLIVLGITVMYTALPMMAERAGMSLAYLNWKPYLACYRGAFFTAVPAFIFLYLGRGQSVAFGERVGGPPGTSRVQDLPRGSGGFFAASDGFVALNLTKGVVWTLNSHEHGGDGQYRISNYRDAHLMVPAQDDWGEVPLPTLPPDTVKVFLFAPIFSEWAPCIARERVGGSCLEKNVVVGWAITMSDSPCTNFGVISCHPPIPLLDPIYRCASAAGAIHGSSHVGAVKGLCGRTFPGTPGIEGGSYPVVSPRVVDELRALLLADGWTRDAVPNENHIFVDVMANDDCDLDPEPCLAKWNIFGGVGIVFAIITAVCIAIPATADCFIDDRLREARRVMEATKHPKALPASRGHAIDTL